MKKSAYATGRELTDKQWHKLEPLIPDLAQSRKDGQHLALNRACLEGILLILRTGAPWSDMPSHFPSGARVLEAYVRVAEERRLGRHLANLF